MSIKDAEEDLPRNSGKVFLDIDGVLVCFVESFWVVSPLCDKRISDAQAV